MWRKYRAGDYKALDALSKIAEAQPLISNYYDATKLVVEDHQAKIREDKELRERLNPPTGMNHVKVDKKGDIYWAEPGEDVTRYNLTLINWQFLDVINCTLVHFLKIIITLIKWLISRGKYDL